MSNQRTEAYFCGYFFVAIIHIVMTAGICAFLAFQARNSAEDLAGIDLQLVANNVVDIPTDWTVKPFINITVVPKYKSCPENTEPIFERLWFGATVGCEKYDEDDFDYYIFSNTLCDTIGLHG